MGIVMHRQRALLGWGLCLLLGAGACGETAIPTPAAPIVVDGLFNLTGGMSTLEGPAARGVELAVKQRNATGGIHGRRIQYSTQDTATDGAQSATATKAALRNGAVALIGYTDTDAVLNTAPLAQQASVPFVTVGATSPRLPRQVGDMLFLACFGDNVQAAVGAEYLHDKLGARNVYLLFDSTSDYTRGLAAYFKTRWGQLVPGSPVLEDSYRAKDTDFSEQIAHIKTLRPAPDAIYISAGPDDLPQILPALRGAGLNQPIMGGDGFDGAGILIINGQPQTNIYYTTHGVLPAPDSGPMHDFVVAYTQEYGKAPESLFAALGYDGARLLFDALDRAPDTNGPTIRAAIEATKDFAGITGTISFGPAPGGHVPDKSVTVIEVHQGALRPAETARPRQVPAP